MNIEDLREFCLSLPFTSEKLPFDENTLVFYVKEKMFALTDISKAESVNLKCEPEKAIELRERYEEVKPGWHMNKKHWNTVRIDGSLSDDQLKSWIKDSFDLVIKSMPKKAQREFSA